MGKKYNGLGKEIRGFNKAAGVAKRIPRNEGLAYLEAAKQGDLAAVTAFIEQYGTAAIDLRDRDWSPANEAFWKTGQKTALFAALCEKKNDVAKYLLSQGADPNAPDKYGYTPLMVTRDPRMAALLLKAGADIEQKTNEGKTALMWPNTAEKITFLISRGANVEARDNAGRTPLLNVAEGRHARGYATIPGNLEALLKGGADIDARDNKGRTGLMNAAMRAAFDEQSLETVEFLIKNNANPHLKDNDGKTAAMLALAALEPMEKGAVDIARLAMEAPDVKLQERLAALLGDTCVQQHQQVDEDFAQGSASKIGVSKPLVFKK